MSTPTEIYEQATRYAKSRGRDQEDFPAWAVIKYLQIENKPKTITWKWWWSDYLRKTHGNLRSSSGRTRADTKSLDKLNEDVGFQPESSAPDALRSLEFKERPEWERFFRSTLTYNEILVIHYLKKEVSPRQISIQFGVSESRIGHIRAKLKNKQQIAKAYAEKIHEKDLLIDWVKL